MKNRMARSADGDKGVYNPRTTSYVLSHDFGEVRRLNRQPLNPAPWETESTKNLCGILLGCGA